jgi:HSP20 family protein
LQRDQEIKTERGVIKMLRRNQLPNVWRDSNDWNPIQEMSRLQRGINRMFTDFFSDPFSSSTTGLASELSMPACDVEETEANYLLSFDLPGVKKDEVKIELQDNYLTISGERKSERNDEKRSQLGRERYYGSFVRSFALPPNINADKVEASYENGVLQVAIPKVAVSPGKQIPIKEGKLIESKSEKAA